MLRALPLYKFRTPLEHRGLALKRAAPVVCELNLGCAKAFLWPGLRDSKRAHCKRSPEPPSPPLLGRSCAARSSVNANASEHPSPQAIPTRGLRGGATAPLCAGERRCRGLGFPLDPFENSCDETHHVLAVGPISPNFPPGSFPRLSMTAWSSIRAGLRGTWRDRVVAQPSRKILVDHMGTLATNMKLKARGHPLRRHTNPVRSRRP